MLARDGRLLTRSTERPPGRRTPGQIDELIDGLESGRIRGDQWIWLADQLRRFQTIYLHRRTWQDLADQLVDELARSSNIAYLARYESAAALMKSPQAQPYLAKSVGRYVLDPKTQVITPVLQVLGEVAEPGASDVVLRLVGAPNVKLRRSAAIVAAAMIRRGNLAPDHEALERQVGRDLLDAPDRTSVVTLDLASRMTDEQFDRLHRSTTDEGVRSTLRQARATRELVEPDQARLLADHIGLHAELLCARASADPDQMLRRLIREALFHVHRSRRHLASALLLASPSAAIGEVVLRLTSHADERVSLPCWSLVGRMTPALSMTALTERVAAEDRRPAGPGDLCGLVWGRCRHVRGRGDNTGPGGRPRLGRYGVRRGPGSRPRQPTGGARQARRQRTRRSRGARPVGSRPRPGRDRGLAAASAGEGTEDPCPNRPWLTVIPTLAPST